MLIMDVSNTYIKTYLLIIKPKTDGIDNNI